MCSELTLLSFFIIVTSRFQPGFDPAPKCMHVCVCVSTYMCVRRHVCVSVCMYVCIGMCVYLCVCDCMHVCAKTQP